MEKRRNAVNFSAAALEDKEPPPATAQPLNLFDDDNEAYWEMPEKAVPLVNVFSMGWMEDGRLGYPADHKNFIQSSPRPMFSLSELAKLPDKFVCKRISAGSRHSLMLMTSCFSRRKGKLSQFEKLARLTDTKPPTKLMITGLNQLALCEEPGYMEPVEVLWPFESEPTQIFACNGNCYAITSDKDLYSWGHGRFGVLGHLNCVSNQIPTHVNFFRLERVKSIATGAHHVILTTIHGTGYAWGKNHKGQLGIGHESPMELTPTKIALQRGETIIEASCGQDHTIALIKLAQLDSNEKITVYGWGEESRGQLGSGDAQYRSRPQENRYITKFLSKKRLMIANICAGGMHNLAIVNAPNSSSGNIIAWGAGDYGQLGTGFLWDETQPQLLNGIDHVVQLSAGLRHSMALTLKNGATEVMGWGYNGYGELGLGDTEMRIIPTTISAFSSARPLEVRCGDRHTVVRTSHRPVLACESPLYRPFYQILEEHRPTKALLRNIKLSMARKGLVPALLDTPNEPLPQQAGVNDATLKSERFERGLRYCMDTNPEPPDWRRNAYETCFKCPTPKGMLRSICLACARECKANYQLIPWIRKRSKADNKCDCRQYGVCVCRWSSIRSAFDTVASVEDGAIGPNLLRGLLQTLRAPAPLARDELLEALTALAEGDENTETPRIHPVAFENWYRQHFDELEEEVGPQEEDLIEGEENEEGT